MKYLGGGASFYRAIISRAREILNNKIRTTRPIMTQDYIRDVKARRAVRGGGSAISLASEIVGSLRSCPHSEVSDAINQ